jgi:tetratricopeptide (TPR) repeat protein
MPETPPKNLFESFRIEVDPERIDESVRALTGKVKEWVDQGRYTKVRISYKGKPLLKDIPLGVFVATEAVTFWYAGLLRALVVNLGVRTFIEVELIHDAEEKIARGIELYMDGEVEAAEDCYREALRMKPGDVSALYNLGVLLRVTGRRAEAIEVLEKAAAAEDHPDAERAAEVLEKLKRGPRTL